VKNAELTKLNAKTVSKMPAVIALRAAAKHVKALDEKAFAEALAKATPGSLSSLLETIADVEEESRC